MPYKDPEAARISRRDSESRSQLRKYRAMGLEPMDIDDPRSDLECLTCGRITTRATNHQYRHEPDCPMLIKTIALLNFF